MTKKNIVAAPKDEYKGYTMFQGKTWNGVDRSDLDFEIYTNGLRTHDGIRIPDKKALFRKDENGDKVYLATVSADYKVIKHSDIVTKVEDEMNFGKNVEIKTILSADGRSMQRMYTLYDYALDINKAGDYIAPSIRLTNSYDGSTSVGFVIDALRLVCTNGMIGTKQFMSMQYRHFGQFANVHEIFGENFRKMLDGFSDYSKNWSSWIGLPVSDERAELVVNYMPSRLRPYILERMGNDFKGDRWSLYNCYTAAVTHDYVPSRAFNNEMQKMHIGTQVTKLFSNEFAWNADAEAVTKDLVKRRMIKPEIEIDEAKVVEANFKN